MDTLLHNTVGVFLGRMYVVKFSNTIRHTVQTQKTTIIQGISTLADVTSQFMYYVIYCVKSQSSNTILLGNTFSTNIPVLTYILTNILLVYNLH